MDTYQFPPRKLGPDETREIADLQGRLSRVESLILNCNKINQNDDPWLTPVRAATVKVLKKLLVERKNLKKQHEDKVTSFAPPEMITAVKKLLSSLKKLLIAPKNLYVEWWYNNLAGGELRATLRCLGVPDNLAYAVQSSVSYIFEEGRIYHYAGYQHSRQVLPMKGAAWMNPHLEAWIRGLAGTNFLQDGGSDEKNREKLTGPVSTALLKACKEMTIDGFSGDYTNLSIGPGHLWVHSSYRSWSLPKEGAYEVGVSEWEDMVERELERFRKSTEKLLNNALPEVWRKQIRVDYEVGEKGYVYARVDIPTKPKLMESRQ